jgi:DNA-binding NarL/FixJ family response regulator
MIRAQSLTKRYGSRLAVDGASDGDQAVRAVKRLKPDVVLMDVRMPGVGGVEATQHITDHFPDTRVLMLTTYDRDEFAFGALSAGAAGFLLKNTRPAELVAAIRAVKSGDSAVSPRVTAKLIEVAVPHLVKKEAPETEQELSALSDRERDVFLLVGRGYTNTEIAQSLGLSESTIKTHFGRVLSKMGLRSRAQAVIRAYELGVVGHDAGAQ